MRSEAHAVSSIAPDWAGGETAFLFIKTAERMCSVMFEHKFEEWMQKSTAEYRKPSQAGNFAQRTGTWYGGVFEESMVSGNRQFRRFVSGMGSARFS
jgi:hypothetical protein